jgi:AcrR family transcriptional regulator
MSLRSIHRGSFSPSSAAASTTARYSGMLYANFSLSLSRHEIRMPEASQPDGRRLRSERSRSAIVDAALALIREGMVVPTAQQIAKRAGVGVRTFFRHFEDMESLFAAVDADRRDAYVALFSLGEPDGTLDERLHHVVQQRAAAYERAKNFFLSTQAQFWKSDRVQKNYARSQRDLRKGLERWIPELSLLPHHQRETVDAIVSFEFWHRLRTHQGLSRKVSVEIVTRVLENLLRGADG